MESINPILMEFLLRSAINKLPDQKREIYQFIERNEDRLEEMAGSEEQFIQLMDENPPFQAAANHFSLDVDTIKKMADEIQAEIDVIIKERCSRLKWIDCTDYLRKKQRNKQKNKWSFIHIS
ncbi:MAG: hypothetical protein ABF649_19640 [Bacillus sp. (in: firmicutes)]